jgi:hypothetical protein
MSTTVGSVSSLKRVPDPEPADNRQLRQAEYRILSNAVWRSTIRNTLIVNAVHLPVSLSRSTLFDTLDFVGIGDADSSDESAYGRQLVER